MRYFLKKCGFQELGSVGDDGKPKRGRYLMVSMAPDILEFFPPLSKTILNDSAVLPIIPLYTGKKTYCNYVYHNDKFNGSSAKHKRNEYRIYLNKELEDHRYLLEAQDIIIMRSEEIDSDEGQIIYYLDVLQDHSSGDYISLSRYLEGYPINGGYALYDGELPFFEKRIVAVKNSEYEADIIIDPTVTKRIEQSNVESRANLFNPATFRDFVLAGYGNACAITGRKLDNALGFGLDVVYIKPRSEGGSCLPSNGLPLTKDYSLLFVQGHFTLTDDYQIIVHPQSDSKFLRSLPTQMRVPPKALFQPDKESLAYHREHIFGSFSSL